ncbi:MAG: isocitrate/isopropylmalate dehydrogenase family protein [Aigarchaeota archaeon]|nr:isocitrate/isopropylmalate dehydrogenase family protein [Aigarchaeota archaeon]MDW8092119.1 isocitrate/isopropylmalate dehydrogenase family protein [Nitrososphaerota archaeon]
MYRVAVIRGDGIGPHVVECALEVLKVISEKHNISISYEDAPAGDAALREYGSPLPEESFKTIQSSEACLKGPVGESAKDVIVILRRRLDLYANLRPVKTLNPQIPAWRGVDLMIVRENTEDVYRGIEDVGDDYAMSVAVYSRRGTERISRVAGEFALSRRKRVTVVDKANVILAHRFFRGVASETLKDFQGVEVEYMYVDNAAYQLIVSPRRFDVILTTNMFGDILSDEAAALMGSLGLAPSANVGDRYGLFEPVHGSAPDIDPRLANPIGTILASAMMVEWLGKRFSDSRAVTAGREIFDAVGVLLRRGDAATPDLGGSSRSTDVTRTLIEIIRSY